MEPIKRTLRVVIEKEIEIELLPTLFGKMTVEEYIETFRKELWWIDDVDDIFKYAARMAAVWGSGEYDGLGRVELRSSTYPREPDVKFTELDEFEEVEFV